MQDVNQAPKLSIGLPVYNGANYLAPTLDCLLAQTFSDFELVISDNASTDATVEIAQTYASNDPRIKLYRCVENQGAAWNFNNVFARSSSQYFKWAAHDDLHDPRFVERCIDVLERDPAVVLCYSATRFIDQDGNPGVGRRLDGCHLRQAKPNLRLRQYFGQFPAHVLFGVVRREALARTRLLGAYASADRVLVSEIALQGQLHELDEDLFIRRVHPNVSWNPEMPEQDYAAWYDPKNRGRRSIPVLRRGLEYARAVHHARLPAREAAACYGEVLHYAAWNHGVLRVRRMLGGPR